MRGLKLNGLKVCVMSDIFCVFCLFPGDLLLSRWNGRISFTGKQAILTIYEDGVEKELVKLYSLQTKEEMHALFQEKGFRKKSEQAIVEDERLRVVEDQLAQQEQFQKLFSKGFTMYGVIGFVALAFLVLMRLVGKKDRRALKIRTLPVRGV